MQLHYKSNGMKSIDTDIDIDWHWLTAGLCHELKALCQYLQITEAPDGWMMTHDFTALSTVFQSYQADGWMI